MTQKYVLGELIFPNENHEFWYSASKWTFTSKSMLNSICGMLNLQYPTTIYFGISETGIVIGMDLDRPDRDEIRLTLDRFTSHFEPQLIHNNLIINFETVFKKQPDRSLTRLKSTFVVELRVCPLKDVFYTLKSGECFVQRNKAPCPLNQREVREIAVHREMKVHSKEIQKLWNDVKDLSRKQKKS